MIKIPFGDHGKSCNIFDFDGCLIKTKSGSRFYKNVDDWEPMPFVINKLREMKNIVIISNQLGISKGKVTLIDFKKRATDFQKLVNTPMVFYIATQDDIFRKPRTGILESLDISKDSIYVGDAAGRPGDHSCVDYQFALNYGIQFYSEKAFFQGIDDSHMYNFGFDPRTIEIAELVDYSVKHQEMIIFTGPPASGKSTLASKLGYTIISRDLIGTISKCLKATKALLGVCHSVVIDNTNPTNEDRQKFIDIANEMNVPYRIIFIDIPKEIAIHLNKYRSTYAEKKIPTIAIHSYYKRLEIPQNAITHNFTLEDRKYIRCFN